jgi:hypothetical protein
MRICNCYSVLGVQILHQPENCSAPVIAKCVICAARARLAAPAAPQVLFTMLSDGTMAAEVEMWQALLQWPFLTDMSLVSSIVSIFVPTWGTGPPPLANTLQLRANAWFYFNLVLKKSQVQSCLSMKGLFTARMLAECAAVRPWPPEQAAL